MGNPALMSVPLLTWCDGEAIQLALGIGELNSVARLEVAASGCWSLRHMRILGEYESSFAFKR